MGQTQKEIEELKKVMKKLYEDGYGAKGIMEKTDCSYEKVHRHLKSMGLSYNSDPLTEEDKRFIVSEYASGKSIRTILFENPYSFHRTRKAVEEAGLDIRIGLRQEKVDKLKECYNKGYNASRASRIVKCTRRTGYKYYRIFENEEIERNRDKDMG